MPIIWQLNLGSLAATQKGGECWGLVRPEVWLEQFKERVLLGFLGCGNMEGKTIRVTKGDTRSLDHGSHQRPLQTSNARHLLEEFWNIPKLA